MNQTINPLLREQIKQEITKQNLPSDFLNTVLNWHFLLAKKIQSHYQSHQKTLTISINGAQGSGKSTLSFFVALILKKHFHLNCVVTSLDDYYLTKDQRLKLASTIHPLLKTRGVPGTHDLGLAISTLTSLQHCSADLPIFVPQFSKADDDRYEKDKWLCVESVPDVILFEGWCNNAPIQADAELLSPINALEKEEDRNGVWRRYVNQQLKEYQAHLFSLSDLLIFIQIPRFSKVLEWRGLQEQKLTPSKQGEPLTTVEGMKRFIEHFERITRHCLAHLPHQADYVVKLNEQHQIAQIENL